MNKFEQLIEYVINDEEAKARELFHELVVEKSRAIYEEMMAEEEFDLDEADQEGPGDLLAAVEEEKNNPGKHIDNLTDVLNATFGSDRSPEFKHARAAITQYLEFVTNADVDHPSDDPDDDEPMIRAMTGGNIARHIQDYDLIDYLEDAAHELSLIATPGVSESEHDDDIDESLDEMGGDAADDLIDDIEVEEEGVSMEGDDMDDKDTDNDDGEELEDRVVDLEDKLDELMSEFESLMGDDAGADMDMDAGDDMDMDAGDDMKMSMEEAVSLKSVSVPVKSEEGNVNKKSVVAANAGARGAMARPVHATGTEAQGRPAPGTKDLVGKVGNTPAQSTQKPTPAAKPNLSQATGVNTRSVVK